MAQYDYNIIVIGGGSAGLVAAYISRAVRAKVALIEQHKMGGDCLNTGCVPSKAFIHVAKCCAVMRQADAMGIRSVNFEVDFPAVMQYVHRIIQTIAPHDSIARYTDLGVDCFTGQGRITGPHCVTIDETRTLTARATIVASGAHPLIPSIPGLSEQPYLTSDNIWALRTLPRRLVILGAGPMGVEMAQAFAYFGTAVTLVEKQPQILHREDDEVIDCLTEVFKKAGIRIHTAHTAKAVEPHTLITEYHGKTVRIPFDQLLVALGRKAHTTGWGLKEAGVALRPNGSVATNPFLQTNVPSIYVCGDATGPYQFTHVAAHQAWYATINALFSPFKRFSVDNSVIPWAAFTCPEVARVGLNEKAAKANNQPYEVTLYPLKELDKAIAENATDGFVKVLTVPHKDRIIGACIVGKHASEMLSEYLLAMRWKIGLNQLFNTIHIYPTYAEANKYAAGYWKRAHVPPALSQLAHRFHMIRRGKR